MNPLITYVLTCIERQRRELGGRSDNDSVYSHTVVRYKIIYETIAQTQARQQVSRQGHTRRLVSDMRQEGTEEAKPVCRQGWLKGRRQQCARQAKIRPYEGVKA